MNIAGIDYGSKLAGTTVIATTRNGEALLLASSKKQDADQMILEWAKQEKPTHLFFDAPLSLPGVYRNSREYSDYFYRQADRQLKAMSPMFLGGLTARAMRLSAQLEEIGIQTVEVYPASLARLLGLEKDKYKKKKAYLPALTAQLLAHLPLQLPTQPLSSWHHFDALLALLSGIRYLNGQHKAFGHTEEGAIVV